MPESVSPRCDCASSNRIETGRTTRTDGRNWAGLHHPLRHTDRARNFNRSFDRWVVKLGLRRITVHGTRKTCGTLLAALDVHPRVAMQILRHSKIAVTMEIYTEATSEATREALRKLLVTASTAVQRPVHVD